MVIHIGPSKTGTSTIQRETIAMEPFLAKDNFVYIGKFADRKFRQPTHAPVLLNHDRCFQEAATAWKQNHTSHFNETPCWKDRVSGIMKYYHKNTSIILSDEGYSYKSRFDNRTFYQLLSVAFEDWNVVVVPAYRRYAEWLLSASKEVNRKGCLGPKAPWKHNKGRPCMDLWKMTDRDRKSTEFGASYYKNLDASLPAWRESGFRIALLDFHGEEHLTCNLFCNLIPNTPNTCKECRKRPPNRLNAQSSSFTAYNDILFAAEEQGVLPDSMLQKTRYEATMELTHYHSTILGKGLKDLPLICPKPAHLDQLLNKSLAFEKMVMPTAYYLELQEVHRAAFWEIANEKKEFCSVDAKMLLNGKTSWREVQKAMKKSKEWPTSYY
ncbi:expressed unknown protein [Seminavis robusta]|uniref:Uncharacterized protein n=1 Tax=Seminavis robusta TaxID=568900 RepID=A0A9N8HUM8_9STRA|nr:expressed unknown protein [Seminavis robusta]|eukprot:Sro1778_g297000.1 n/a (382) ;mRNA; f:20104-21249